MSAKPRRKFRDAPLSDEEALQREQLRAQIEQEFPPATSRRLRPAETEIGARIRQARDARGWSWYKLAQEAGVPNPNTVRDIEYGRDAKLSNIQAIASALNLRLELVEQTS